MVVDNTFDLRSGEDVGAAYLGEAGIKQISNRYQADIKHNRFFPRLT